MKTEKTKAFAELTEKSVNAGSLKSVVFHSPSCGDALKVRGELRKIGNKVVLRLETSLTEGRVRQENIAPKEIPETVFSLTEIFRKADLTDSCGNASLMISKKGTETLIKKGNIGADTNSVTEENNREKKRLLNGNVKFLRELGISDETGRIHDKRQSKFRQIARFAEYITEAEQHLEKGKTLTVCDLCCGKSYLSFAAYHVLTEVCGRDVVMYCVDLKESVIEYCSDVAKRCSMDGMRFIAGDVSAFEPPETPDLVISLHACDTATDLVLSLAVKYGAKAILATPCCHRYMSANINCGTLDFITDRPILSQKFCSAATDALRLLMLDACGYKTDATELIDPEDTPKNVMLRAYRREKCDSADIIRKAERYQTVYKFLYGHEDESFVSLCTYCNDKKG